VKNRHVTVVLAAPADKGADPSVLIGQPVRVAWQQ